MRLLAFVLTFLVVCISLLFGTGCANIVPPAGGPRDSIPPRLVGSTPPDSSTNFNSNRIQLTFDEYIDLKDVQNNLLFTPTFDNNPEVSVRAKTVTVRFKDTLAENTTYLLNFGNAIVDYTEGNVLKNFIYTFSTGETIDSLEISGKVQLAESGKTDSTLIVVLHTNLADSAIEKLRPVYVARVERDGSFRFHNLPAQRFAIYALGDAGLSRRYQRKSQLFAFSDSSVVAGNAPNVTLYAYREVPATTPGNQPTSSQPRIGGDRRLQYTTNLSSSQQYLTQDLVLTFSLPLRRYDSSAVTLAMDSTFTRVPFTSTLDSSRKNLSVHTSWTEGALYHLILNKDFAEDTAGLRLLKTDTLNFAAKKNADYGKLSLRFRNVDTARRQVLQLVQNDKVVHSIPVTGVAAVINLFNPGEYELRVLYDANKNGVWDPGSFEQKRQPEMVKTLERRITIKPNWENEFEINL